MATSEPAGCRALLHCQAHLQDLSDLSLPGTFSRSTAALLLRCSATFCSPADSALLLQGTAQASQTLQSRWLGLSGTVLMYTAVPARGHVECSTVQIPPAFLRGPRCSQLPSYFSLTTGRAWSLWQELTSHSWTCGHCPPLLPEPLHCVLCLSSGLFRGMFWGPEQGTHIKNCPILLSAQMLVCSILKQIITVSLLLTSLQNGDAIYFSGTTGLWCDFSQQMGL